MTDVETKIYDGSRLALACRAHRPFTVRTVPYAVLNWTMEHDDRYVDGAGSPRGCRQQRRHPVYIVHRPPLASMGNFRWPVG